MKSLILILMTFSIISQAAEMEVDWVCPQENYPGVPQLEQNVKVKVVLDGDGVKFKPDPFKAKLLGDGFFRSINPLNKTKNSLAVDYSDCVKRFVSNISSKIPEYKNEWTAKIQREIDAKSFLAKSQDKKLLPTKWSFNEKSNIPAADWSTKISEYCEGKTNLNISTDMLNSIKIYAGITTSHPSKSCMDKIAKTLQESISKNEEEFCQYSEKICSNLKISKTDVLAKLEETKAKRDQAMKESEVKFRNMIVQDQEAGYEEGFNDLMNKDPADCKQYSGNLQSTTANAVGSIVKMHNLISKNLDRFMEHMDGTCQQQFIRNYLDYNNSNTLIGDWSIVSYCKINESDFCTGLREKFKIVEENIERMLEKAYGQSGKEFYNNVACEIDAGPQALDTLLGQLKQFDKALACRDLKIGESQVVGSDYNRSPSPTGIPMTYSMERTGDKTYKARFNLSFKQGANASVTSQEMFNRAQTCMKDLSPYFKGPNGEVMEVDIINSEDAAKLNSNQRPPKVEIGINGPNHISNSGDYNQNIDCGTIAHEVMHLTGLCDEYKEKWNGNYYDSESGKVVAKTEANAKFLADYNCRVVAPIPSIMSSQGVVIDNVVPKSLVCECDTEACKKFSRSTPKIQNLFINDPFAVGETRISYEFCEYKEQPQTSLDKFEEDGEYITVNKEAENELNYTIRYWQTENPTKVQNLKVNCACTGEKNTEKCAQYLSQVKEGISTGNIPRRQYCPAGSKNIQYKMGKVGNGQGGMLNNDDGTFSFNGGINKPDSGSLLHPQHFERIIGGTCPDKAKSYSSCAQFAYKTDPSGKCPDVPKECQDPKYFLGTEASKQ